MMATTLRQFSTIVFALPAMAGRVTMLGCLLARIFNKLAALGRIHVGQPSFNSP